MAYVKLYGKFNDVWQNIDLYDDEQITLESKSKEVRDLDKVFAEFTRNFTIPATSNNNKLYQHYYNPSVADGFDPQVRVESFLEVNGILTRKGFIEFLAAKTVNDQPDNYQISFFAEVAQLSETFSDDELEDMDWSALNHTFSFENVTASWEGSLLSGDVLYPLIDFERGWIYSSDGTVNDIRNIADSDYGIELSELKPSVSFRAILDTIESEYDLTFNLSSDVSADFDDAYMLFHRDAGNLINQDVTQGNFVREQLAIESLTSTSYSTFTGWAEVADNGNNFDNSTGEFTAPETGLYFFAVNSAQYYTSSGTPTGTIAYQINGGSYFPIQTLQGGTIGSPKSIFSPFNVFLAAGDTLTLNYKLDTAGEIVIGLLEFYLQTIKNGLFNQTVKLNRLAPKDYKVTDFINTMIRMFNLVIEPVSDTEFNLTPQPTWQAEGTTRNYDEYVDYTSMFIRKPDINRIIDMRYEEGKDIALTSFREVVNRQYSSARYEVQKDFAKGELSVVPKATPVLTVQLLDQQANNLVVQATGMNIVKLLDRESKSVVDAPRVFYFTEKRNCLDYYLQDGIDASGNPTFTQLDEYPFVSMFENYDASASDKSLNFSIEEAIAGTSPLNTLYERFYGDQVEKLYDSETRLMSCEARIPIGQYLKLQLNDTLIIDGSYWTIDKIRYNLNTERAQLELTKSLPNYIRQKIESLDDDGTIGLNFGTATTTTRKLFNLGETSGGVLTWITGNTPVVTDRIGKKKATELPLTANNGSKSWGVEG